MRRLTLVFVILILLSTTVTYGSGRADAATATPSLKLSSLVQSIPADGGTYAVLMVSLVDQNSKPLFATSNFEVFLASSNVGTGTVPAGVDFPVRAQFVLVNFTSTATSGSTLISASSQGVKSSSLQVQTTRLGGFPTTIMAYAAPSQAVAQPSYNGTIVVELVDDRGNPAEALNDTVVTLVSSNARVVNVVDETAEIPAGQALTTDGYNSTLLTGTAQITLSSPGFKGGRTSVTVLGSTPTQLGVETSGNPVPPDSNQTLVVSLLDQSGNPTLASSDITVTISSSNTSLVSTPVSADIAPGSFFVPVDFQTLEVPPNHTESATVTVSSTGLTSASTTVNVARLAPSSAKPALGLSLAPPTVLANAGSFDAVFVYLKGAQVASSPVSVSLFSSNPEILNVTSSLTIDAGASFAVATVSSSYLVGSTQITASAQNFLVAEAQMRTYGQTPSRLVAVSTPPVLTATGNSSAALSVGLVSQSGLPATAAADTVLNLVSSNLGVVQVDSTVTIPAGQSSVLANVTTTTLPGQATITVSGSGYTSAATTITTVVPGASALKLSFDPQPALRIPSGAVGEAALQLLDGSGNPVQTKVSVSVSITATNRTIFPKPINVTVPAGGDLAVFPLQAQADGTTTLTATAPGLRPSSLQVQFLPYPLKTTISASASSVGENQSVILTLHATVQGYPLAGANVRWSSGSGVMNPQSGVTDGNGTLETSFRATVPGTASVTATLGVAGLGPVRVSHNLMVIASGSSGGGSNTLLLATVGGASVVVAVVAGIIYIRRKGSGRLT